MYDVFEQLLKRDGITAADFSRATGISEATISTWKKRDTISTKHIQTIISYFNVSPSVFFAVTDEAQKFVLMPDETYLLLRYKDLNETGKRKAREYVEDLIDRYKNV